MNIRAFIVNVTDDRAGAIEFVAKAMAVDAASRGYSRV